MEHILTTVGGRRVLVADVTSSTDGRGVGYGIMLKRIDKVLGYARATGVDVFYVREAANINRAVFRLEVDGVRVLPRHGWKAYWLRFVWAVSAPFRLAAPWLWFQRTLALVLRDRGFGRRFRRACRQYAARSGQRWKERYRRDAKRTIQAAITSGQAAAGPIHMPAAAAQHAALQAAHLGIGPDARIVTVHVRESGYRAAAGLRQRQSDALRNARIETFSEAVGALIERGYVVVRLGDSTMTPVDWPGVIDLAHLPQRSEWLEIWCVQRSEFLIGCDSGPSWLAFLLGIPVLTVNALHLQDIERPRDRLVPKLVRERSSGRVLRVLEMLTPEYLRDGLDTAKYEHLDNSPEDLRAAVLDMVDVVSRDEKCSLAQRRFRHRLVEVARQLPHTWTGLQGIAVIGRPRGSISRPFAKKYL